MFVLEVLINFIFIKESNNKEEAKLIMKKHRDIERKHLEKTRQE